MSLEQLLSSLQNNPEGVAFNDVISVIDRLYDFSPTPFQNGGLQNGAGENNGSCKIFAFAKLQGLSEEATLHCFGDYYREDVLKNPDGADHQNIRNFIKSGWGGVVFDGQPLIPK